MLLAGTVFFPSFIVLTLDTLLSFIWRTEAVETWRNEKLKEAKEQLIQEQNGVNSTMIQEEAGKKLFSSYHDNNHRFSLVL